MRNGDKEAPPSHPLARYGVRGGTGADTGAHGGAGIRNMGAYVRKMALNGYVLHVDLAPVRELVSLQRRCANNLNQVAIHANTYGVYPEEIAALQKDYAALWEPLSDLLEKLAEVVEM